jgi:hypothetical protein
LLHIAFESTSKFHQVFPRCLHRYHDSRLSPCLSISRASSHSRPSGLRTIRIPSLVLRKKPLLQVAYLLRLRRTGCGGDKCHIQCMDIFSDVMTRHISPLLKPASTSNKSSIGPNIDICCISQQIDVLYGMEGSPDLRS